MAVRVCFCVAKLSPNKKSIFGLWTQILSFVLIGCFVACVDAEVSCSTVRNHFETRLKLDVDIQEYHNSDAGALCLNQGCCGAGSRPRLQEEARTQLQRALKSELNNFADLFVNKARKFDELFRQLLQNSKVEFHSMFKRTYGMIYEQHSFVFERLFEKLESYYSQGNVDLEAMVETFFGILYQKMFVVLNSQYNFDSKYLECVSDQMPKIQPFEEVPGRLSSQLRRAFVATRTFHKALRSGADVIRKMNQVEVTSECAFSWARLRFCGACAGQQVQSCSRYCHNVLRGCLPTYVDLGLQWEGYVVALEKVAERLLDPFNVVMVVEPIGIKISEAIMNFQEHNPEISQKIFSACGKPVLGGSGGTGLTNYRRRRDIELNKEDDDFELDTSYETLLRQDPSLNSLGSKKDIDVMVKRMAEDAEDREKFLQYVKGDLDQEEYEEHERKRREANPEPASSEIDYRSYDFEGKKKRKKKPSSRVESDNGWDNDALNRLVRDIRNRVREQKSYWKGLPFILCNEHSEPTSQTPCFNGSAVATYTLSAAGEGSAALASNPEVRGSVEGTSVVTTQQDVLKTLTSRLKDAFNGVDVQWPEEEDQVAEPSDDLVSTVGSGSGSGDEFPDDEDINPPEMGSGEPPVDREPLPPPVTPKLPVFTTTASIPLPPNPEIIVPRVIVTENPIQTIENNIDNEITDSNPSSTGSANKLSLHRALFTYAMPVVCAWFGTLVTDLI